MNEEIKCSVLSCQNETEYQNNSHIFGVMDVCVAVLLSRSRKQGEILKSNYNILDKLDYLMSDIHSSVQLYSIYKKKKVHRLQHELKQRFNYAFVLWSEYSLFVQFHFISKTNC